MSSFKTLSASVAVFALVGGCAQGDTLTGGGGSGGSTTSGGGSTGDGGRTSDGGNTTSSIGGSPSTGGTGEGGTGGSPEDCGNGAIDAGEDCDGTQLGDATCVSLNLGYIGGTLGCASDCTFDVSACQASPNCGNGAIDPPEECDGTNLDGATCTSEGFGLGTITCGGGCVLDTSQCYTCGDAALDGPEVCDGTNLNGATCTSLGHDGGTLSCGATCLTFNEGPCSDCGDGLVEGNETCDGSNLNGATCASQGFSGGTLSCNAACSGYVTTACTTGTTSTTTGGCTNSELITGNPGFESGPNGGFWTESSTNFGTPVCDAATCGTGGGTGPFAGTYWVWIGGTNTAFEQASVSRSVVIPTGTATLTFEFDLPSCEDPGFAFDLFQVTIDGNVLFSATNSDAGCGAVGYQLVTVGLNGFANGGTHTLAFSGQTDDFFAATNFFVDNVSIISCH